MKKLILIAMMASGLVACAQSTAPQEDSRLKEAYNMTTTPTSQAGAVVTATFSRMSAT